MADSNDMRVIYSRYMDEQNVGGSGKASSYVRALDLLGPILAKNGSKLPTCSDVWTILSADKIAEIYEYVLEQQRLGETGIFKGEKPASYWRSRYCSAALKSYKEFLIIRQYKDGLWQLYNKPETDPFALGRRLARKKIKGIKELVSDKDLNVSTKEGKDVVRRVKARVNQDFFREMILLDYETQCCVTGLNVPQVLRASHIVGWAEDKESRLNPANGLCLSATYDAAFDWHLISFDEDYRMIFSPALKEYYSNAAFKTQFFAFEGRRLSFPKRFRPNQVFLEKHREKLKVP